MNKVQELKAKLIQAEHVEAVRKERVAEAQKKLDEIVAKSKLGRAMARLQKELAEAKERAAELETELRAEALTFHTETGDKKPAVGVEVQKTVAVTVTDMDAAVAYTKTHAPKLVITKFKNLSSGRAWLKRQVAVNDDVSEFVTLVEGTKIVLKKKLWAKEAKSEGISIPGTDQ